jgi:MFS family permease
MMRTMMPFYAQKLGAASGSGATLLGGLEAAYGVGQMAGAAVLGRLSDVYGRRAVLVLSFAGSTLGYSMAGLATTPGMLLASRVPVGLAKQTVTVSRAVVADCTAAGRERSVGMSRLVAAFGVGTRLARCSAAGSPLSPRATRRPRSRPRRCSWL